MSSKLRTPRSDIAERFIHGICRKEKEIDMFSKMAFERTEKYDMFSAIVCYLRLDTRFYSLAAHYYGGDLDGIGDGNEDLLILSGSSELPPIYYSEYLRHISAADRNEERITHTLVLRLKEAMNKRLEEARR